jgi:FkbM family methyltransferase
MIVTFNGMSFEVPALGKLEKETWEQTYEEESQIDNLLKKYIRPNRIFVDVGACLGQVSLRAYSLNASAIYAVEASPSNAQAFRNIISINSLDKINLSVNAIYKTSGGMVKIGVPPTFTGGPLVKRIGNDGIWVETITLADFLGNIPLQFVNIVKIDIEGAEEYIGGSLDLLRNAASSDLLIMLTLHLNYWENKKETSNMFNRCFQHFNIFDMDETPICGWPACDKFGHFNILLRRKEYNLVD